MPQDVSAQSPPNAERDREVEALLSRNPEMAQALSAAAQAGPAAPGAVGAGFSVPGIIALVVKWLPAFEELVAILKKYGG